MKIVIIDYGMGNIASIAGALKYNGVKNLTVSNNEFDINSADKLILPGVGNFAQAISIIRATRLDLILQEQVINKKKPLLGICLGMQLLGQSSPESGLNTGLNFIDAHMESFSTLKYKIKVPHVGFNQVFFNHNSRLYSDINTGADFYFTHGYKMISNVEIGQATCKYPDDFIASFEVGNIAGVQFHPELSQKNGLKLIHNFLEKF